MSRLGGLARFTPSVLDKDTLEALFVHRESLVEDAVDRVRRALTTKERANRLFVGPRGAGKTHLVSLIAHRSRALDGFGERFQLAWLPEDLWAIGDFDDLRKEILKAIEPAVPLPDEGAMDGGPREFAGRVAERGPVVVIIENLDQVLDDLGPDGQRKLRAAIESDRSMLFIATATRLTSDLLDQDSPFYGFFDTFDLQQFDVDEAADMLKAIARHRGDEALVDELDKPQARARLAAVAHLAGGQPRIWALFGAGLTVEGLDDLVSVLLERFDDLTPYYQEQLRRLSVNERKAVQALAEADRALPVKTLAELTGISERSLSKTMSDLRKAGWVKVKTGPLMEMVDKRLTYYELAEPLARLAFQLKAAHGQPVRLVVDFLRTWFDPDELSSAEVLEGARAYLEAAGSSNDPASDLCRALIARSSHWLEFHLPPSSEALLEAAEESLRALASGDASGVLGLPSPICRLIEDRVNEEGPSALLVELHWRAVVRGDASVWRPRLELLVGAIERPYVAPLVVLEAVWLQRTDEKSRVWPALRAATSAVSDPMASERETSVAINLAPIALGELGIPEVGRRWLEELLVVLSGDRLLQAVVGLMVSGFVSRDLGVMLSVWELARGPNAGSETGIDIVGTLFTRSVVGSVVAAAQADGTRELELTDIEVGAEVEPRSMLFDWAGELERREDLGEIAKASAAMLRRFADGVLGGVPTGP